MSCEDEDCPGCLMTDVVKKLGALGFEPEDMLMIFFDTMKENFKGHFVIEDLGAVKGLNNGEVVH